MLQKESVSISETGDCLALLKSGSVFKADLSKDTINALHESSDFWNYLLSELRYDEIRILELLYLPKPTTTYFKELSNKLALHNIERTAIRSKIDRLAKIGLIEIINAGILCIDSIPAISEHLQKFIVLAKMRFGVRCTNG